MFLEDPSLIPITQMAACNFLTSDTRFIHSEHTYKGLILSIIKVQKKSYNFSKYVKRDFCPLMVTQSIDENLPVVSLHLLIMRECYFPLRVNKPNASRPLIFCFQRGGCPGPFQNTQALKCGMACSKVQPPALGSLLQMNKRTRQALGQRCLCKTLICLQGSPWCLYV